MDAGEVPPAQRVLHGAGAEHVVVGDEEAVLDDAEPDGERDEEDDDDGGADRVTDQPVAQLSGRGIDGDRFLACLLYTSRCV